jgi:hypothetical protein
MLEMRTRTAAGAPGAVEVTARRRRAPLAVSQVVLRDRFPAYEDWADVATYTFVFLAGYELIWHGHFTADPTLSTYMVGHSFWELMRRMETGIEQVTVP